MMKNKDEKKLERLNFKIQGMHCANCALTIEKKLSEKPSISRAVINLALNEGVVEFNPEIINKQEIYNLVKDSGYSAIDRSETEEKIPFFKTALFRFLWSFSLTIPLLIFHHFNPIPENLNLLIIFILATILQFTSGLTFYRGSYYSIKNKSTNMDVLVALGVSAAYFYSAVVYFLRLDQMLFFEAAAMLFTFITFGKYLEEQAKGKASSALKKLLLLQSKEARIINKAGKEEFILTKLILENDIIIVKAGEKIPVDGEIVEGSASIDEAMVSGESIPVEKKPGDNVTGGTINLNGFLKVKTSKTGANTFLSQIIQMVSDAQTDKAPIQRFADRVSNIFVPIVVSIAVMSFLAWYFIFNAEFITAFRIMISVLVVACPCALGLATPTAIMVGSGIGLKKGILFKKASVLENISKIDTIVLDKTGTLTIGKPTVTEIISTEYSENEFIKLIASVENKSTHPLAKAVVDYAIEKQINLNEVEEFNEVSGSGVTGKIENKELLIGNREFIESKNIVLGEFEKDFDDLEERGRTVLLIAINKKIAGLIGIRDQLRKESKAFISYLNQAEITPIMLTGDNEKIASIVAEEIGIKEFRAKVLPTNKNRIVRELKKEGRFVAMVGDGINDAPALAAADVGIALGSGTDVAQETGDVILVNNKLFDVYRAIKLGAKTLKKVKQNLFWAMFYNSLGIPIAAGLLYPFFKILLRPEIAGLAMALSSVSVVTNSILLSLYSKNNIWKVKPENNRVVCQTK